MPSNQGNVLNQQKKTVWRKLGHVYKPSGDLPWARSHAANPIAEHVKDDLFNIYFSARDEQNRSSIGRITIDINSPQKILDEAKEPVLAPGDLGMFDDCGASVGCILNLNGVRYLYYMGWNLTVTVPWKNAIGMAVSKAPGEPFVRYSRFPVVELSEIDPYTISYPWVSKENGLFRMWYGSNLKWGPVRRDMIHILKYAESEDGINWKRNDKVIIDTNNPEEYAICKPCVLKTADGYRMWFCSRGDEVNGDKYRIQLAESANGVEWTRLGKDPGIDVSESGWDSDMIEYPSLFEHKGKRYLLYAGNEFGKAGFGIAVEDLVV